MISLYIVKAILFSILWLVISTGYMVVKAAPFDGKNASIVFGPFLLSLFFLIIVL